MYITNVTITIYTIGLLMFIPIYGQNEPKHKQLEEETLKFMGTKEDIELIANIIKKKGVGETAEILANLGDVTLPSLIFALEEKDRDIRFTALYALRKMGPRAQKAVPALVSILQESTEMVHYLYENREEFAYNDYSRNMCNYSSRCNLIIDVLFHIVPNEYSNQVIENSLTIRLSDYIKGLEDQNYRIRVDAARELGNLDIKNTNLRDLQIATLIRGVKDPYWEVRREVINSLSKVEFGNNIVFVSLLIELLHDENKGPVREIVVKALGQTSINSASVEKELINTMFKDEDFMVRYTATQSLAARKGALWLQQYLLNSLKNKKDIQITQNTLQAIGYLGREGCARPQDVIPVIIEVYKDHYPSVIIEYRVYQTLSITLERNPETTLPILIQYLKDENCFVRKMIIMVLENLESKLPSVLPNLQEVAEQDPDEEVRRKAKEVIKK